MTDAGGFGPVAPTEAERNAATLRLVAAVRDGRIDLEGFERRVAAVQAAATRDLLAGAVVDIPRLVTGGSGRRRARRRILAGAAFAAALAASAAIAAVIASADPDPVVIQVPMVLPEASSTTFDLTAAQFASLEDRAEAERWFDSCSAAEDALAAVEDGGAVHVDRLSDVVPAGPVGGFDPVVFGPVTPGAGGGRPWMDLVLHDLGATEGFSTGWNSPQRAGGGGMVVYVGPPGWAREARRRAFVAMVCHFGAEPGRIDGVEAPSATRSADGEWVIWVRGDMLVELQWSNQFGTPEDIAAVDDVARLIEQRLDELD